MWFRQEEETNVAAEGGEWAERSFGGIGEEAGCRVSGRGERCGRVAGGRCGCSGGVDGVQAREAGWTGRVLPEKGASE